MLRNIARCLTVAIAIATLPVAVQASMYIDRTIVSFLPGQASRQDVVVTNPAKEPLYVQVEVFEVQAPGTEAEQRVPLKDPASMSLLATPNKLIVPAGESKVVRLVSTRQADDTERVYRVNFRPIVGKIESEATAVKVLVGYQVLALVAPKKPAYALEAVREGTTLHLKNPGNTNILFFNGQQCPSDTSEEAECRSLPDLRLYPGNERGIELPLDRPVDYYLTVLEKNEKRHFD
ncbi:MAG: molecular chaperone [Gammaproteobacteria bacterium]